MKISTLIAVAALALGPGSAKAEVEVYSIDPVHTRVVFFVGHAGHSRSIATISGATGELAFDPDNWEASRVDVTLPASRIDFGDEEWNRRMAGRGFFRAARHPAITFVSSRVEHLGGDKARIHGELSVAGQSQDVILEATLNSTARNIMTFRRTVGFSASTILDRRDFRMSSYPDAIGNEVEVLIEVEAVLGRASVEDEPADAEEPDPLEEER